MSARGHREAGGCEGRDVVSRSTVESGVQRAAVRLVPRPPEVNSRRASSNGVADTAMTLNGTHYPTSADFIV